MNLNELAKSICEMEGGKVSLPIGQVKEVMRIFAMVIATDAEALASLLMNGKKNWQKELNNLVKGQKKK